MKKILRFHKSLLLAISGLYTCCKEQSHFNIHLFAASTACVLSIYLKINAIEWMVVCLTITAVLAFELINTAIEYLCDMIHPTFHQQIKKIKDIASAAVFLSALSAVLIGLVLFLPKLITNF